MQVDSHRALKEGGKIQYFWQDIKPLVKIKIEQYSWELDCLNEIVKKMVDTKAKTAIMPPCYTCETNQYYAWANRLAVTKSHAQDLSMKNSKVEEQKIRPQNPDLLSTSLKLLKKPAKIGNGSVATMIGTKDSKQALL